MKEIRQTGHVFLIIREDNNYRLCQDNRWRGFAMFGTTPGCVKEYKSKGHAERKANRVKGTVVAIPNGYSVDAGGNVFDENDKEHPITAFK
jgi:hypothetical protein